MTVTVKQVEPVVFAPELPDTKLSWPEANVGVGFSTSERVDLAAAWFENRTEVNVWDHDDRSLMRVNSDGGHSWIDPATGEIVDATRPQSAIRVFDTWTGRNVESRTSWTGEQVWIDTEFDRVVDPSRLRATVENEKLAGALDYSLTISPGTLQLRVTDPRDSSDPALVDEFAFDEDGVLIPPAPARGQIREFTARSRHNLIGRVLKVPWADYMNPGDRMWMVTLTAPGQNWEQWLGNHDLSQKAMKRFSDKLSYSLDRPAGFVWKREFQRRGAPHWHLILVAPDFIGGRSLRQHVSQLWFEAVGSGQPDHLEAGTQVAIDESLRASDPMRTALYFAGYSTTDKEYQHVLPYGYESPLTGTTGQWWGAQNLKTKEVAIRITRDKFVEVQRILRASVRARRGTDDNGNTVPLTKVKAVPRSNGPRLDRTVDGPNGPEHGPELPLKFRRVRRRHRVRSFKGVAAGCTAFLNDAPNMAVDIARALALDDAEPWPSGVRRPLP